MNASDITKVINLSDAGELRKLLHIFEIGTLGVLILDIAKPLNFRRHVFEVLEGFALEFMLGSLFVFCKVFHANNLVLIKYIINTKY